MDHQAAFTGEAYLENPFGRLPAVAGELHCTISHGYFYLMRYPKITVLIIKGMYQCSTGAHKYQTENGVNSTLLWGAAGRRLTILNRDTYGPSGLLFIMEF